MSRYALNTFALTMLITGAIDSIRNLPASALFGSTLIFFFIISALVFLIPAALVSAELAANVTDKGGVYHWVKLAFGEKIGFLAIWLQWINNIAWFPTILSFIAGTAAYLINPELAQNKYYLVSVILVVFWTLTIINLKGIRMASRFASFCAMIGLIVPVVFIIALLVIWVMSGKPLQIHLTASSIFPDWHSSGNWVALTAIMTAFLGMELATVHIKEVSEPNKTFPRALAFSTVIILTTMILGSLAIAYVLPYDKINLVNGTMQTFSYFLASYNMSWLVPILTVLLIVGSIGGITSWVISPIKGLLQATHHGFLPTIFKKENKHGVAQNLLLLQAVLVSFVCLAFLLIPSVNGSYWLLTALSTQLYMLMYVLMFLSALVLRYKLTYQNNGFIIPGKKLGLWLVCLLGLVGCTVTIIVGFLPPDGIDVGDKSLYQLFFTGGMILLIAPVIFFYLYQRRSTQLKLKVALEGVNN